MHQLGMTHAAAVFIIPRSKRHQLPTDPHTELPLDASLPGRIKKLWTAVEGLGPSDAYKDSELLMDILREGMK